MNIINVGAVGFSGQDQDKLKKIFQLSKSRSKTYAWADYSSELIDILMVATDDLLAVDEQKKLQHKQADVSVVSVSKTISAQPNTYHIKPPLLSVRVLRVLDQIDTRPTSSAMAETPRISIQDTAKIQANHDFNTDQKPIPRTPAIPVIQPEKQNTLSIKSDSSDHYQVLVIDDSSTMQKALQIELLKSSLPIEIDCVDSGEAALLRVKAKTYDFIFLDIMMPGIDGYETCTKMRQRPEMKKTPIIMLSGKTSPLDEVKGIMAGSTTYLTKPIKSDEFQKLLTRVGGWLGKFSNRVTEPMAG